MQDLRKNLAQIDELLMFVGSRDALFKLDLDQIRVILPQDNTKWVLVDDYNHGDYMWASDAHIHVNQPILDFVKKHNQI